MQFDATRSDLTVGIIGAGSMQVLITDSRAGADDADGQITACCIELHFRSRQGKNL